MNKVASNPTKRIVALLGVCALSGCTTVSPIVTTQMQEAGGVRVEATWTQREAAYFVMVLKLINLTGRTLEIPHSALWRGNLLLFVADADTGEAFEETSYFDDYPAGSSKVAPGMSVEREVALSSRFPQLSRLSPDKRVVVLWSASLPSPMGRVAGFLEVRPGAS